MNKKQLDLTTTILGVAIAFSVALGSQKVISVELAGTTSAVLVAVQGYLTNKDKT